MSGYLYFNKTGNAHIDKILSVLEGAGNAYHHTSEWDDEQDSLNGKSYLDLIQDAADDAAKALAPPPTDTQEEKGL
ncbi:hypothetical protein KAR91_62295 [Candidatus Pacearchaeota archaeon]|nr:hypothetical protein [Candidatus Pacearchaeota archaeon]